MWRAMLPILGGLNLGYDSFEYLDEERGTYVQMMSLNIIFFIGLLIASRLPTYTVCSDALIVGMLSVYTFFSRLLVPHQREFEALYVFILCQGGVHSLPVFGYLLFATGRLAFISPVGGMASVGYGIAFVISGASVEYIVASLWAEVQEQKMTLNRLLDHASNGFCAVDPVSGSILSADKKLQETLGVENLEGTKLVNYIREPDVQKIADMYMGAADEKTVEPLLATCVIRDPAGFVTFDAKIIPYSSSKDSVNLCIQVQGSKQQFFETSDITSSSRNRPTSSLTTISWNVSTTTPSRGTTMVDRGIQTNIDAADPPTRPPNPGRSARAPGLPRPPLEATVQTSSGSDSGSETGRPRRSSSRRRRRGAAASFAQIVEVEGNTAQVPQFAVTSAETCLASVKWLIRHWNLPKQQSSCCPWHAAVRLSTTLLQTALSDPCQPTWSAICGWQCRICTGMNKDEWDQCQLCFEKTRPQDHLVRPPEHLIPQAD